ncbi:uncharacterized protein LOC116248693 isoform X2 [Nymphaea colorata]|nr:uncharacterized protein LOC116248693 isoform X2 [Nymphaea colorata]
MDSAGKQSMLLLFLLLLELTACIARDLSSKGSRGKLYPEKPPVTTIKREDGELIDCIDIYSQPAFGHPALKNHTIQMEPSSSAEKIARRETSEGKADWWRSRCPPGTVPVPRSPSPMSPFVTSKFVDRKGFDHEHAYLYERGVFHGTKARFNVWNPQTEGQNGEFSLAQLWVLNDGNSSDLNSIEAGWHVFPSLNGDSQPRLFVYWTRDNYGSTGCYNLKCPGFVQVSDQISPGMAISPVSAYEGEQVYIDLIVFKDAETGNWWLKYEDIYVGYWPSSLFTTLADAANLLEWGGEVARPANGPRLATKMGSGHFPSEGGDGISSSVKNIECLDATTNAFVQPTAAVAVAKVKNCYDINNVGSTATDGYVIYFGGPGKSDTCL